MTEIRLYGTVKGHGSWTRVTRGVESGLRALGLLAGLVPIDAFDEEEIYPGHDAPVGLVIGPPAEGAVLMRGAGWHERRLVLLAPNSTWLPWRLLQTLAETSVTGLLSPSHWGKTIIDEHTKKLELDLPCEVYPHGVSEAFRADPSGELLRTRRDSYNGDCFHVLHLASTTRERKGTSELIQAWQRFSPRVAGFSGADPRLTIVIDATRDFVLKKAGLGGDDETIDVVSRLDLDEPTQNAFYQRFHAVCQPSRAEGFGLVPLEAAAAGVLPIMTQVTGHDMYVDTLPAVVRVKTGPLAPIDDGPGAEAPSLSAQDVLEALDRAYDGEIWDRASCAAHEGAAMVSSTWSWERASRVWARKAGLLKGEA